MKALSVCLVCVFAEIKAFHSPLSLARPPLSMRAMAARRQQVALKAKDDQEITDVNLEEMFEVKNI